MGGKVLVLALDLVLVLAVWAKHTGVCSSSHQGSRDTSCDTQRAAGNFSHCPEGREEEIIQSLGFASHCCLSLQELLCTWGPPVILRINTSMAGFAMCVIRISVHANENKHGVPDPLHPETVQSRSLMASLC